MTLEELKDELIYALNAEADAKANWLELRNKAERAREEYARAYIEENNPMKAK